MAAPLAAPIIVPGDRAEWDAAMAEYLSAKRVSDEYNVQFYRIHDEWKKGQPDIGMIDLGKDFPFQDKDHIVRHLDLEKDYAAFVAAEGKTWWGNSEKMKAERRAVLDSIAVYRKAKADNDARWNIDASADRSDDLAELEGDAAWKLIRTPAPDAAALEWKLDYLYGTNACDPEGSTPCYNMEDMRQFFADVRRLSGSVS